MTDWQSIRERMDRRISRRAEGCWEWLGSLDVHGYARMHFEGKNCKVSRVAWSAYNETVWPTTMHALHSCDNRLCVNPAHIRPGTNAENIREAASRNRLANQRKTHCPRGHEYTPENTARYACKPGQRGCRECARIKGRIRNATRYSHKIGVAA